MRRLNSSVKADFVSEKGIDAGGRTYFAYVPLENMVCYAVAESYDFDNDINSAKLAVDSVLVAFERKPDFKNIKRYIQYANDEIKASSVKNKLEVAITVVVSDYTRIRYASCGNIKFYLLSDNAFYLKSETQTYYQFAAREYGANAAPLPENKNLTQYLGKSDRPKPYLSKKIDLPEESTMLFTTCSVWERLDDIELVDAYEESKPEEFTDNIESLLLLTQLKDPAIRSYTIASLFVEKTYKEDTAKQKKRRRFIITLSIIAVVLAIIATIVISILRATDRRAMDEITRLDNEGIRYSNYGNYAMAYEQYVKANELCEKLRNNWQYKQAKKTLSMKISERWHLFNSIMTGDDHMQTGNYHNALKAYEDAQDAYYEVYKDADMYSELMVSDILSKKIALVNKYIAADDLVKIGEMYEVEEMYQEALSHYREADSIAQTMGDLVFRRDLLTRIFDTDKKLSNLVEVNFVRQVRALMDRAEANLNYELAMQYAEFIVSIYNDLGVTDTQALDDIGRIAHKTALDTDAESYITRAELSEAEGKFADAVRDYEIVLELYGEMQVGVEHESFRTIIERIARLEAIIASAQPQRAP